MINISFPTRSLLAIGLIQVFCCLEVFGAGDDFNDNAKDAAKWGTDILSGTGVMTETNQRLEYTCPIPSLGDDSVDRAWILSRFPYNADWEIQIDTINTTSPSLAFQVNSFGFQILSPLSALNNINVELYSSALGGGPARNGFDTNLDTNDVTVATSDTGETGVTNGAVRMVFTAATKVITVFYDLDVSDGYQWVQYGSFGLAGSGGVDGNTDWGLTDTDQFSLFVYGFSQGMTIASGQLFGDNFMETGGTTPAGPPSPVPAGSFHFAFPTNNPLLTAIVSIAGNYHGSIKPTDFVGQVLNLSNDHDYHVDIAEDESGKLSVMGTIDGVVDNTGDPLVSGSVGQIATVNGQPTAQLNASFVGTRDGLDVTASATATGTVELVDIGGGTLGSPGTGNYASTVAGIPFSGSNVPIMFTAPPEAADNLKNDWSLQLDIHESKKGKAKGKAKGKGQETTVASAQLVLPNGDTIRFPEKAIKRYSAKKGHALSFVNGTNVTMNPPVIDRSVTITLTGLKFTQQNGAWHPSAGTITYQFLGQKGTANVMDFLGP